MDGVCLIKIWRYTRNVLGSLQGISQLADEGSSFFTCSHAFHIRNISAHASNYCKQEMCFLTKQQRACQERGALFITLVLRQVSPHTMEKMKKLFNISYFIASEQPFFCDFADLCKLHVKHGLFWADTKWLADLCKLHVKHGLFWRETYISDKGNFFVMSASNDMEADESWQLNEPTLFVMADRNNYKWQRSGTFVCKVS